MRLDEVAEQKLVEEIVHEVTAAFEKLPYILQAHLHETNGAWHRALAVYRTLYEIDSTSVYIWRHIAKALTHIGDFNQALSWWQLIVNKQRHPSHLRRLAYCLSCLGKYEEAVSTCASALAIDSQDAKTYLEHGNALHQLGRYEEAIASMRKAARYDAANAFYFELRIAEILQDAGQFQEALRACLQADSLAPDDSDVTLRVLKVRHAARNAERSADLSPI